MAKRYERIGNSGVFRVGSFPDSTCEHCGKPLEWTGPDKEYNNVFTATCCRGINVMGTKLMAQKLRERDGEG
jgi:hypothetical protein